LAGARLCSRFQQASEKYEGDDHSDGLKVNASHICRQNFRDESCDHAVPIGSRCTESNECVHLRTSMPESQPTDGMNRPADIEHDWSDQHELRPMVHEKRGNTNSYCVTHNGDKYWECKNGSDNYTSCQFSN